jgi:hypothetical protein
MPWQEKSRRNRLAGWQELKLALLPRIAAVDTLTAKGKLK